MDAARVTITSVEQQPQGVAAVTIDGDPAPVLLLLETAILHRLRAGIELPRDEWQTVVDEGRTGLAVRRAIALVARRPLSESEVRGRLDDAFTVAELDAAIARLRELGAVNDARWSAAYVAQPRARTRGKAMLTQELERRGVDRTAVHAALAERDEQAAANEAADKRIRALRGLDEPTRRRRLHDYLRRRGFSDEIARRAVTHASAEDDPGR